MRNIVNRYLHVWPFYSNVRTMLIHRWIWPNHPSRFSQWLLCLGVVQIENWNPGNLAELVFLWNKNCCVLRNRCYFAIKNGIAWDLNRNVGVEAARRWPYPCLACNHGCKQQRVKLNDEDIERYRPHFCCFHRHHLPLQTVVFRCEYPFDVNRSAPRFWFTALGLKFWLENRGSCGKPSGKTIQNFHFTGAL